MMEKIIRVEHVDFSYNKPSSFIKDMSFEIPRGKYTCIIGPNGSGKTTVSKLISGVLVSDKGDIFVDGLMINNQNMPDIRKYVSVIFQNPDNQYMSSSLKEDIIFALENHCVNPSEMEEIINNVSKKCDVLHLLSKGPSSMSGGEKQKGNLASALALNPKVLVLDEAYSMLDGKSKKEMRHLINSMKEEGVTIVSITHDSEELLIADYIILMNEGTIVFEGNREDLYKFDTSLYNVELPYIMQLEKEMGYDSFEKEDEFFYKVGETL